MLFLYIPWIECMLVNNAGTMQNTHQMIRRYWEFMIRFHYSTSCVIPAGILKRNHEFHPSYYEKLVEIVRFRSFVDKLLSATFIDSFLIHPIVSEGSKEQRQVIESLQLVVEAYYGGGEALDFAPSDIVESVQANLSSTNITMHFKVLFFNPRTTCAGTPFQGEDRDRPKVGKNLVVDEPYLRRQIKYVF